MSLKRCFVLGVIACLMAGLLVAPATAARARGARAKVGTGTWSNPATWGGKLPEPGEVVTIPHGATVHLDVSPPALAGISVDGTLEFAEMDLELSARWIMVHGTLRVGRPDARFKHRAVITLTGSDRSENIMDMGTKVIGVMGGLLELHGRSVKPWTKLGATARKGDSEITLAEASRWRPGDRIVIASTDYWSTHDEERTVVRVSGSTLELDEPLDYMHWGELQTFAERVVDERAEVGLLSRNILIRGDQASRSEGFGGHIMVMAGGRAQIDGVELTAMGQKRALRRYPVHFHMDGDAPDSYLKRSAIHHTFNRCLTIHGTNETTIKNNVCFDHLGHGFFLEDGAETDNLIVGNLGLGTRKLKDGLLPTDKEPATYWITNPDNIVRNNVAAGSESVGFWYALPEHPTGLSEHDDVWPRRTPLGEFSGNVAHSNGHRGLNVDDGPRPNGTTSSTWYEPISDPTDRDSDPVVARFENFTAYMNRDRGVWLRGEHHVVTGAVLADNRLGATFASSETFLEDSLVVGETANKGNTEEWEDAGHEGRALPYFWRPEARIVGFEFYDGRVGVRDTTFVNFNANPVRKSGALAYLEDNHFAIHPRNFAERVTFVDAAPVSLSGPEAEHDGDTSAVFVDNDGSVTGTAGRAVVVDNPFLLEQGCVAKPAWNAHVCPTEYVNLIAGTSESDWQALKPLTLRRSDGATQPLHGCCDDSDSAVTSIIPERAYTVDFNGPTPDYLNFVMWRGRGRWLRLTIPISGPIKVTRWDRALATAASLDALDAKTDSAYFYDPVSNKLHIKIMSPRGDYEEVEIKKV